MGKKQKKKQATRASFFSPTRLMLLSIFLLALALRLFHLGQTPIGFHVDELDAGYIGRYILLHGKDVVGNVLPLYFNKFGDFRPTGIFYLSGLSTFLFGVTEFAVRFPSAFIGALSIFPLYFLASALFGRKSIGFIAAGLLAVSPWHIVLSRATSESIIGLFLLLFGLWFVIRALNEGNRRLMIAGSFYMVSTYAFYHTFRALVPIFLLPLFLRETRPSLRKLLMRITGLFFAITIALSFTNAGSGRLNQVAFYKNPDLKNTMTALLAGSKGPIIVSRIFHNKPVLFVREYVRLYVSYYSPNFLFLTGGYPDRYRVPEQGLFYIIFLPMLFVGLCSLLYKKEQLAPKLFILFLLVVATLPASLTYEDAPNVQRAVPLMIPLFLLMAYGTEESIRWVFQGKMIGYIASAVFALTFVFEISLFSYLYFIHADSFKSVYRNDGNRELFARIKELYPHYDYIVMSAYDELPTYAAFYLHEFGEFPSQAYSPNPGEFRIGKVIFMESKCPLTAYRGNAMGKGIFVGYDGCPGRAGVLEQKTVMRSDSTVAYRIFLTE